MLLAQSKKMTENQKLPMVISRRAKSMISIILNRPDTLNSLNIKMIDVITDYLQSAIADQKCNFILFYGNGGKGFCAGGDVKELAQNVRKNAYTKVNLFFKKEYALDLMIHNSPKPVVVIAEGTTMGGGLGIAAGADIVFATEKTRMAMPETKIGFFPDVGATGWLFAKCPKGYPEYLALTGYDLSGLECVRLGLATHFINSNNIPELIETLEKFDAEEKLNKDILKQKIIEEISKFIDFNIPTNKGMDDWVAKYFARKADLKDILTSLTTCGEEQKLCAGVFTSIAERSPTALVLTLKLLRHNEGREMPKVFAAELKAADFLTRHHDYLEGVRARLLDRDNKPRWRPAKIDQVDLADLKL
jgi:enoyl-CoA hydratase/carnithine racemase